MKAPEVLQVLSDKCRRMHLSYATDRVKWLRRGLRGGTITRRGA